MPSRKRLARHGRARSKSIGGTIGKKEWTKRKTKSNAHYVDNARLTEVIRLHKEATEAGDKAALEPLAAEFAAAIGQMAEKLLKTFRFRGVDVEDATQEACMTCLAKMHRFNPERGSLAFNYFTTCILNHFRQLWRTGNNYQLLKDKRLASLIEKEPTHVRSKLHWRAERQEPYEGA